MLTAHSADDANNALQKLALSDKKTAVATRDRSVAVPGGNGIRIRVIDLLNLKKPKSGGIFR